MSEDDYVGYYQSLMILGNLWGALDQYIEFYYDNCCHIAYIVEEHMKTDLDRRNISSKEKTRTRTKRRTVQS